MSDQTPNLPATVPAQREAVGPVKKSTPVIVALVVIVGLIGLTLIGGTKIEQVIAILERRRSAEIPASLSASRAREIATTAQRVIARQKFTSLHTPKENHHATA